MVVPDLAHMRYHLRADRYTCDTPPSTQTEQAAIVYHRAQAMKYNYQQLDDWQRFRIATFMHAIFNLHGRNRDALKKAAEDCAGWYYTDVNAIVKVWHKHFPNDFKVEIDNNSEGVEAP